MSNANNNPKLKPNTFLLYMFKKINKIKYYYNEKKKKWKKIKKYSNFVV